MPSPEPIVVDAADVRTVDAASQARLREALRSVVREYECPITHEPVRDPVTAMDGCVYERAAIERWIASSQGVGVRSPMTNGAMGRELLPALQARNVLRVIRTCGLDPDDERVASRRYPLAPCDDDGGAFDWISLLHCHPEMESRQRRGWVVRGTSNVDHVGNTWVWLCKPK